MRKKLTAVLTALLIAASLLVTPTYAENDRILPDDIPDILPESGTEDPVDTYMFSLPKNMRAAFITPSVDFFTSGTEDEAALSEELSSVYAKFAEIGLNSVIINTVSGDNAFYSFDLSASGSDPVTAAIESAYEHGISPYVVFDIGHALSDCGSGADIIDSLISRAHRFTLKYTCEGIILDDYYAHRDIESFADYMQNGSGVGYTNWLYDTSEQYFRTAAEVIRGTDNSIAAGFLVNDMWANSSDDPDGSSTNDYFQAYFDGYSDTRSFIGKGYADFVMLRAYGSQTSTALPFGSVTGWWSDLCNDSDVPLYIVHHNEFIGTSTTGWDAKDQIVKQLDDSKKLACYSGSVFNSFESLNKDPLGSTEAISEYFGSEPSGEPEISDAPAASGNAEADAAVAEETARVTAEQREQGLIMTSPSYLTYTTPEASVAFMGSFDKNYPVYFNGTALSLNDAGNFYFEQNLEAGLNTFTVSHKDKTYTYNITRKISVLKTIGGAIAEGRTLSVEGGTKINFTAKAYRGSTVYGTINGATVTMSEMNTSDEEEDANSTYVRYSGTYTVPEGIVGQAQQLGQIKIYGSYGGYSMAVNGATVTVNAKPQPVVHQETPVIIQETQDTGSGEVVATLETTHPGGESVQYVRTLYDNTIVYDGKTADDIASPVFSQLPANTLEIYKSTSGNYYITESGKRIATSGAVLETAPAVTSNNLFVRSIGTSGGNSYIKFKTDKKTGFNMRLAGNSYYTGWDGGYNVSDMTATHLYVTFEDVTSVTSLPSFENNYVFRSGKWDTVTEENGTKFRLILELRQPGVYFGHGAKYDSEGCLILSFPVPVNTLSGLTVVIDPGHGYGKSASVLDPGAIGEVVEQEVVLAIAKELESQLTAAGANVVRLKTESQFLLTKERPTVARGYGCDIFISIHANKATGEARGAEAYYFTSYSQPLAASISSAISGYLKNYVYSDGADKNRGAKYSYYYVTLQQDFPSVLVETGFVDNIQDAMALASPEHRKGIAAAIVTGIKNYLARSSISYAPDGYSAAQMPSAAETTASGTVPDSTSAAESTADTTEAPSQESESGSDDDDEVEATY